MTSKALRRILFYTHSIFYDGSPLSDFDLAQYIDAGHLGIQ
ncbi:hypothetical protein [Thiomicrospira microaerophila]|nr:hypothetical protein [Thiomicrospira microaerophila]